MTQPSDQHLVLGPVPDQVSPDVGGLVRRVETGNGVGEQLRSLAHPNCPYGGTGFAWRGFVADVGNESVRDTLRRWEAQARAAEQPKAWPSFSIEDHETRYQKLSFGPELT